MQVFRETLDLCGLQDIHCNGDPFTWVNRRNADNVVFERLDSFVGCLYWRLLFPTARASSLDFYHLDHSPICIDIRSSFVQCIRPRSQLSPPFRFENCWLLEADCREIVIKCWGAPETLLPLLDRISACELSVQSWAALTVRHIPKQLKMKRGELSRLRTSQYWNNSSTRIRELETEVEKLASHDEIYWHQRSRIYWLLEGDRNSNYFHLKALSRKA